MTITEMPRFLCERTGVLSESSLHHRFQSLGVCSMTSNPQAEKSVCVLKCVFCMCNLGVAKGLCWSKQISDRLRHLSLQRLSLEEAATMKLPACRDSLWLRFEVAMCQYYRCLFEMITPFAS